MHVTKTGGSEICAAKKKILNEDYSNPDDRSKRFMDFAPLLQSREFFIARERNAN